MVIYITLFNYQVSVFVSAMAFLCIGFWGGHMLGKDNRFKRDAQGRFTK